MKVLIVEDETIAYENMVEILSKIDMEIEVAGNTESIDQTVGWLRQNPAPDLILMDIHLSDGSAFAIFENIEVDNPIIFTTAYDEYALDAFKQYSVDYLLKPIKAEELERAIIKFSNRTRKEAANYLARMSQLSTPAKYKDRLLIPVNDKLVPVDMKDVSCFYTTDKQTCIYLKNGKRYPIVKTLEQIYVSLDPACFYRANKQFIISRESVKDITIWFDNRLLITLDIETPERIYISKNKAAEFKAWMVNDT